MTIVQYLVFSVKWYVLSVKCEVRSAECEESKHKGSICPHQYDVYSVKCEVAIVQSL